MKNVLHKSSKCLAWASVLALATGLAVPWHSEGVTVRNASANAVEDADASAKSSTKQELVVESIEPTVETDRAGKKEVPWLGIGTEEVSEALAAQLDLKPGQGLVVTYVDEESPAAKAGLQKNDVVVEFEGQMLVHPGQLKKLVQMHQPGDSVELSYFRGAKKQSLSATLSKTKAGAWPGGGQDWEGSLRDFHLLLKDLPIKDTIRQEMESVRKALARAGIDQESVQREIRRSLDSARRGMDEALRNATNAHRTFGPAMRTLKELANKGVVVDDDATVTVKSHSKRVKTIVKSDDSGTYVVVANPQKQLTAHDKEGKLLFDGKIETPEEQEKVPAEVWEKVKPMIDQMGLEKEKTEP